MRRWLTLLLLALSASGWLLGWSPYLRAQSVAVEGAQYVTKEEVITASGISIGQPLARITGARVERALTSLPRIEAVKLVRGWPDRITIVITERQPVAVVGSQVIDANGVLFDLGNGEKPPAMKITRSATEPNDLQTWLNIYRQIDQREQITEVDLRDLEEISFRRGSTRIIWGSADATSTKLRVLTQLASKSFSTIDLSAPLAPTTTK